MKALCPRSVTPVVDLSKRIAAWSIVAFLAFAAAATVEAKDGNGKGAGNGGGNGKGKGGETPAKPALTFFLDRETHEERSSGPECTVVNRFTCYLDFMRVNATAPTETTPAEHVVRPVNLNQPIPPPIPGSSYYFQDTGWLLSSSSADYGMVGENTAFVRVWVDWVGLSPPAFEARIYEVSTQHGGWFFIAEAPFEPDNVSAPSPFGPEDPEQWVARIPFTPWIPYADRLALVIWPTEEPQATEMHVLFDASSTPSCIAFNVETC